MDKSEGKDWFAKTLNNITEKAARIYKISRLKLDITGLDKNKNEKINLLSRKTLDMIAEGKLDSKEFEPEYSTIISIKEKVKNIQNEIDNLKSSLKCKPSKGSYNKNNETTNLDITEETYKDKD